VLGGAGDDLIYLGRNPLLVGPRGETKHWAVPATTSSSAARGVIFCGDGYDRVWHGGDPDPKDRFHDCEEFSDHP
jgi:hypothetical protein